MISLNRFDLFLTIYLFVSLVTLVVLVFLAEPFTLTTIVIDGVQYYHDDGSTTSNNVSEGGIYNESVSLDNFYLNIFIFISKVL